MLSNNFQTVNVNNKTEKEIGIQNLHFPAFKIIITQTLSGYCHYDFLCKRDQTERNTKLAFLKPSFHKSYTNITELSSKDFLCKRDFSYP